MWKEWLELAIVLCCGPQSANRFMHLLINILGFVGLAFISVGL
jgi:hypothetical protein